MPESLEMYANQLEVVLGVQGANNNWTPYSIMAIYYCNHSFNSFLKVHLWVLQFLYLQADKSAT